MHLPRPLSDRRGTAAAEMALVTPLLMTLLFGSVELGNYFWSEHVLSKGVRDAAVYASRLPIENYVCPGPSLKDETALKAQIKQVITTGEVSGGIVRLPRVDDLVVTITPSCNKDVGPTGGKTTLAGIYALNGGQVPVLRISATVPYRSLLGVLGLANPNLSLNATEETAVVGI